MNATFENATLKPRENAAAKEVQLATFYLGDLLLGLDISLVQEINRQLNVTTAPHAPDYVRGVVNLRGEVVTLIDLRAVLGLPPAVDSGNARNLIVHWKNELVGLLVDRIADILTIPTDAIDDPPANVGGVAGAFFRGVYSTKTEIVVVLDPHEVLNRE